MRRREKFSGGKKNAFRRKDRSQRIHFRHPGVSTRSRIGERQKDFILQAAEPPNPAAPREFELTLAGFSFKKTASGKSYEICGN